MALPVAVAAAPIAGFAAATLPKTDLRFVIDGCGSPLGPSDEDAPGLSARSLSDAKDSGITAINVTVGPVGERPSLAVFEGVFRDLAKWEREIARHSNVFLRVNGPGELDEARTTRRVGLVYGLQDGVAFQDDLSRLEILRCFGVRIVQPTYNGRNLLGDGCLEPDGAGLSRAGREAVERMNVLGILVDLSHCGRRTTADALAASRRPVAFTHTGCAALADHPRNKTDEELRALANRGGVAGIYFMPYLRPGVQPMAEDVVRHVEHAVKVAGEDHVGIGTDGTVSAVEVTPEYREHLDQEIARRKKGGIGAPGEMAGIYPFVPDLNTPRRLQKVGQLLEARGHPASRVEKVLGGNFARLFREAWKENA